MTITKTADAETAAPELTRTLRPTHAQVIDIIVSQHPNISIATADMVIELFDIAAHHNRCTGQPYLPFGEHLDETVHDAMDEIAPDDTQSTAGSAHRAIEDLVLESNEMGLTHTRLHDGPLVNCAVVMSITMRLN